YISNQYADAIERWEKLLAIDPEYKDAREFILTARGRLEKEQQLVQVRRAAEEADSAGDSIRAGEAWREVLELAPGDDQARRRLEEIAAESDRRQVFDSRLESIRSALTEGRLGVAEDGFAALRESFPEEMRAGQVESLQAELEAARDLERRYCDLMGKAELAYLADQNEAAMDLYQQALAAKPGDSKALEALRRMEDEADREQKEELRQKGIKLANRKQYAEALEYWLSAITSSDDLSGFAELIEKTFTQISDEEERNSYKMQYAVVLARCNHFDEALAQLAGIGDGEAGFEMAQVHRGTILAARDRYVKLSALMSETEELFAACRYEQALRMLEDALKESSEQELIDFYIGMKTRVDELFDEKLKFCEEFIDSTQLDQAEGVLEDLRKISPYDERLLATQRNFTAHRQEMEERARLRREKETRERAVLAECVQLVEHEDFSTARKLLDSILEEDPGHEEALAMLDRLEAGQEHEAAPAADGMTMIEQTESTSAGEHTSAGTDEDAGGGDDGKTSEEQRWLNKEAAVGGAASVKKPWLRVVLVILVAVVGYGAFMMYSQWRERRVLQSFELGVDYYNRGAYVQSIAAMQVVLSIDTDHAEAMLYIDRAKSKLLLAEEQAKNDVIIAGLLSEADALYEQGDLNGSLAKVTEVLEIDRQHLEAKNRRAVLSIEIELAQREERIANGLETAGGLIAENRFGEAAEILDELAQMDPDNEQVNEMLERAQQNLSAREAQQRRDARLTTLLGQAESEFKAGNVLVAYEHIKQARLSAPNDSRVKDMYARIEPAAKSMQRDQFIKSEEARLMSQARTALSREEYGAAMKALDQLLAVVPDHVEANQLYETAKRRSDQLSRSAEQARQLREYIETARAQIREGKFEEALVCVAKAEEINPDSTEIKSLRDSARQGMAMQDKTPPNIQLLDNGEGEVGKDLKVTALVKDDNAVNKVTLSYKQKKKGSYSTVMMTAVGDDRYEAVVPGSVVAAGGIEVYVSAEDSSNNQNRSAVVTIKVEAPSLAVPGFF
ncbi:hypothetical protein JW905_18135, partial [bacterium]|nr:hypothetical protein [candidate division CSSED10-310 bacterium]